MSKLFRKTKLTRRHFLKLLALATVPLMGGAAWANSYRFELSFHQKSLPKLKQALRVAHLSDLHYGRWVQEKDLKKWVDATLEQKPDVILITGDFVDYTTTTLEPLVKQLSRLKAPLGVFGVWGNHDYDQGLPNQTGLTEALSKAGIQVLSNTGSSLRPDVYLAGIDDIWHGKPNLAQALSTYSKEQACLLMAHIPDILPEVPQHVDMTFCGHTHGGQVKLPLIGAVVTSSAYGKRFLEGWMQEPVTAYVSRGLGMVSLPLRFLSQAEIAVFDFVPSS